MENETDNKTFWNEKNNRTKIDLRNIELGNWRATLTRLIRQLDNDINGEGGYRGVAEVRGGGLRATLTRLIRQ